MIRSKRRTIKKISTRFLIIFLIITITIFLIFFLVVSSLFSDKFTEEINIVASQQLQFASSILDSNIEKLRDYHFSLIKDPTVQNAMNLLCEENKVDKKTAEQLKLDLKRALNDTNKGSLNVRSVFALTLDNVILDPLYSLDTYEWIVQDNLEFDRFLKSQLNMRISAPSTFPFEKGSSFVQPVNTTITCFGHLYKNQTYEDMGYLAINVNQQSFFKDMANVFGDTFASFYVVDENQNIIYSNLDDQEITPEIKHLLAEKYSSSGKSVSIDNSAYMGYSCSVHHYPHWTIIGFIDYENVCKPIQNIFLIMLLVILILIIFAAMIHSYLARRITIPIQILKNAMRMIRKGEWPEPLAVTREDEISEMLESFNKMNVALQKMTAQIAEQQETARKNEVALIQSKLDLLESQINPHFIHNTLNTMKYLAKLAHADRLENLIVSFNALLRTSMSMDHLMIPLCEEAENIYHYVEIQKERYDFPIDFQCEISPDARFIPLPKLILQPLVENALFHGIAPNDGGIIRVHACVANDRLWVMVWDNGTGISKSELESLEERLQSSVRGYRSIGITNVNERLVLSYGESSHLVIESEPNKGTTLSFNIPAI